MRTMRAVLGAIAIAATGALGPALAHAAKAHEAPPDLSGAWTLDRARSDDPEAKMREAMEAVRARGGGPPGMRGGGPGIGGGPPGMGGGPPGMGGGPPGSRRSRPDGDEVERGDGSQRPRGPAASTPDAFELSQAGDTLAFLDRGLRVRAVLVGGKPKSTRANGVPIAAGRWRKGQLLVTSESARGGKLEEVWALADDGATLRCTSTVELPGPGGSVEWTRVYVRPADAAGGGGGTP